ncbi:MAG: cyclic nucleotide-binding domain-containing protein [bacterium]
MNKTETYNRYQWILGSKQAAVKKEHSRVWYVADHPDNYESIPFGLALSLARPEEELSKEPSSSYAVARIPFRFMPCPAWMAWIILIISFIGALLGLGINYNLITRLPLARIDTLFECERILRGSVLGYLLSVLWQASVVLHYCQGKKYIVGFGGFGIVVEPVVWRLGIPSIAAFFSLILPLIWGFACLAWKPIDPILLSGFAIGFWIYTVVALFPLRPGPGTRLMEKILRVEDLPEHLRWAITSRFLPAGQTIETDTEASMAWAAFSLIIWINVVVLTFLSLPKLINIPITPGGLILKTIISIASVCFAFGVILHTIDLCQAAFLLRGRNQLQPMILSDYEKDGFNKNVPLFQLLPELAQLPWQWSMAQAGTFLTRYGERDRTFYWLSSGEANVLGRTPSGNVIHSATLHGDTGIGEIAFLDDRPRVADVLITKSAIVGSITFEQFYSVMHDDFQERFRAFILTGQAFEQSQVFSGIPDKEKHLWIQNGTPVRYKPGDIIIQMGNTDRWVGLIITGEVEVIKDGQTIGILNVGDVLGEIAFLEDTPRMATLRALQEILLWRWDPEWLRNEIDRTGLRPILEHISHKRCAARVND